MLNIFKGRETTSILKKHKDLVGKGIIPPKKLLIAKYIAYMNCKL